MFDATSFLKTLPDTPGVYTMRDAGRSIIYVGKAKNLKKRVGSYFQKDHADMKTKALVAQIADIEVMMTHTEKEALLLEATLIKENQPRYNVLFKDDKTYPYLFLGGRHDFPRLKGVRTRASMEQLKREGEYFGPYPSMHSVKQSLELLQKIFKLRTCEEAFFKNRTRPCLLYQIKRCSGPCVGLISKEEYGDSVHHVRLFLEGRDQAVGQVLSQKMDEAATALQFEEAGRLRDQIKMLREVQETQIVHTQGAQNLDVVAIAREGNQYCIVVLWVRKGHVLGSREYFSKGREWDAEASMLQAFLESSLSDSSFEKVLSHDIDWPVGATELSLHLPKQGLKKKWLSLCQLNAREALMRFLLKAGQISHRLAALQARLGLVNPIKRIECFDISHTQGEETVGSCVVFNEEGAHKKAYRRFNVKGVTPGDDYAAMHQVLTRRFARLTEEGQDYPDLVIIDGGKGQLKEAVAVLAEVFSLHPDPPPHGRRGVQLLGIAKGPERKAGAEELWTPAAKAPLILDPHDEAFLLIQAIRDEAHRFAITGHRKARDKKRSRSLLEDLPNIGPKRRQAILKHCGGWQEVSRASIEELAKVPGVSLALARDIYESVH